MRTTHLWASVSYYSRTWGDALFVVLDPFYQYQTGYTQWLALDTWKGSVRLASQYSGDE